MFVLFDTKLSLFFMIIFVNRFVLCEYKKWTQLEATTNYEERRKIRTRLRQVMAEKEGKVVTQTTKKKKHVSNSLEIICVLILDFI